METQTSVCVNGIRLCVRRWENGRRPLVLVHGLSDSSRCWLSVVARLEADYSIIAYDLRGHGLSEAPSTGYSSLDHARDLLGLLDALKLSDPLVLGHSLGAETAAVAASIEPRKVARLVLEDPPWLANWIEATETERRAAITDWYSDVERLQSMSESDAWAHACRVNPNWSEDERRPWLESKQQMRLIAFESAVARRSPWQVTVKKLECPTLLLSGDVAKYGLVSPEVGREATALNPNVTWVQLLNAGHCIHRDGLTDYLNVVEPFLRESERGLK